MMPSHFNVVFDRWRKTTDVEIVFDEVTRSIYSTDASVYQERPVAVAFPKTPRHIADLIELANEARVGLIPRAAGTSLAGQVVGSGIVVDVSRHMNEILEVDASENWVRVQPGVIRDELNRRLSEFGLMFAPETSTSNRAMTGGMVGNNSCGANSIVYGTTRDHTISVGGFLSDGSFVTLGPMNVGDVESKIASPPDSLEQNIYRGIVQLLSDSEAQAEITREFPKPTIHRRNTGYAVDALIDCEFFGLSAKPFNLCQLIAGSEGTLFFATEIQFRLSPLPQPFSKLVCAHFQTIDAALQATQLAMRCNPSACELIDRLILEGATRNMEQQDNTDFVVGNPGAILVIEIRGNTDVEVDSTIRKLLDSFSIEQIGYAFPILEGNQLSKVWSLRKSGLGVINNVPSDTKPVAVIEDAAVDVEDLPKYVAEVNQLLAEKYDVNCVNYGHAGAGELHLRPVLDLKTSEGVEAFEQISVDVAHIVKKYRGSLSGEHGDGRLRGERLKTMVGPRNYKLFQKIKRLWDPNNIFNPGKIVDTRATTDNLRYDVGYVSEESTILDFSSTNGMLRATEMCNGSADCRKTHFAGGTMCPSYMATRNEADSTRARANLLRQSMTNGTALGIDDKDVMQILDLCLSCKGCKRECPSNVDMAKLKAEFTQRFYDQNGIPRSSRLIANSYRFGRMAMKLPWLFNHLASNPLSGGLIKRALGFTQKRELPKLAKQTLRTWFANHKIHRNAGQRGEVHLFADEFTEHYETHIGIATVELLERLGWKVNLPEHTESGRVHLSQGLLRQAREIAMQNVACLSQLVTSSVPLVGIEPSTILTFRDEYPDLLRGQSKEDAIQLANNTFMVEEFLDQAAIEPELFTTKEKMIRLHGHCHQKATASLASTIRVLQIPKNYTVRTIPSGCCGMAGSFGYEKEHYELSIQIGELVLFPTIRTEAHESIIAAPGTSCRQQIVHGTQREALHPVEILRDALPG